MLYLCSQGYGEDNAHNTRGEPQTGATPSNSELQIQERFQRRISEVCLLSNACFSVIMLSGIVSYYQLQISQASSPQLPITHRHTQFTGKKIIIKALMKGNLIISHFIEKQSLSRAFDGWWGEVYSQEASGSPGQQKVLKCCVSQELLATPWRSWQRLNTCRTEQQ